MDTIKRFEKQARQGDVVLVRISKMPDGVSPIPRENGRVVVAHGEVTGHAHAISEKHVRQFRATVNTPSPLREDMKLRADGQVAPITYLEVTGKPCILKHDEHSPIEIRPGVYEVRRQREYVRGQIRNVAD